MKSKNTLVKMTILIFVIVILFSYFYALLTSDIPINKPSVKIEYNDKVVPTSIGEYTWSGKPIKGQKTGSSYLAGPSYDVGMAVSRVSVKPNSEIEVIFTSAPVEMTLRTWVVGNSTNYSTEKFDSLKQYTITLPNKKGEYIFEVIGDWGEANNISTIFRVNVE